MRLKEKKKKELENATMHSATFSAIQTPSKYDLCLGIWLDLGIWVRFGFDSGIWVRKLEFVLFEYLFLFWILGIELALGLFNN